MGVGLGVTVCCVRAGMVWSAWKVATIVYEFWTPLNVYDATGPTEVPFTVTSDIW